MFDRVFTELRFQCFALLKSYNKRRLNLKTDWTLRVEHFLTASLERALLYAT